MILFIIYLNIFDDFLLFHGISVMLYTEFCYVNIAYSVIHTCFFALKTSGIKFDSFQNKSQIINKFKISKNDYNFKQGIKELIIVIFLCK